MLLEVIFTKVFLILILICEKQKAMTITFPELPNYTNQLMLLNDTARLRTSSRSIATFFQNRNLPVDYKSLFGKVPNNYPLAVQNMEDRIAGLIKDYLSDPKDDDLVIIFHHIQFWGGKSGRNIYVKNGGFDNNFNIDTYKKIVEKAINLSQESLCDDLSKIAEWFDPIPQLGISFGTKHLRFWSLNANKHGVELPIMDSVIAENMFTPKYARWKNYCQYVKQMQEEANKRKVSVTNLERLLFNHFN